MVWGRKRDEKKECISEVSEHDGEKWKEIK